MMEDIAGIPFIIIYWCNRLEHYLDNIVLLCLRTVQQIVITTFLVGGARWRGFVARADATRQPSSVLIWLPSVAARTYDIFVAGPCSVLSLLPSSLLPPIAPALCLSRQNCVTGWAEVPHHCIVISACVGRLAGSVGRSRWSGEQAQHQPIERSTILSSSRVTQMLL